MQICLVIVRLGSQARAEKLKAKEERIWEAKGLQHRKPEVLTAVAGTATRMFVLES